jgi:hypothetical protein
MELKGCLKMSLGRGVIPTRRHHRSQPHFGRIPGSLGNTRLAEKGEKSTKSVPSGRRKVSVGDDL